MSGMGRLQAGVVVLALSAALALTSYARAAAPEDLLGRPVTKSGFGPASALAAGVKAPSVRPLSAAAARRYSTALDGLKPEGSVNRGAKESRIYREASPSVVLIVTDEGLGSGAVID